MCEIEALKRRFETGRFMNMQVTYFWRDFSRKMELPGKF